eukprot:2371125-Prymnesium_polylepis.1
MKLLPMQPPRTKSARYPASFSDSPGCRDRLSAMKKLICAWTAPQMKKRPSANATSTRSTGVA